MKEGNTASEYDQKYKKTEKRYGRRKIILSKKQQDYIKKKVTQGRAEEPVHCSVYILYHHFKEEFVHIEGNTIVDVHHKSAIINLVARLSKSHHYIETYGSKSNRYRNYHRSISVKINLDKTSQIYHI